MHSYTRRAFNRSNNEPKEKSMKKCLRILNRTYQVYSVHVPWAWFKITRNYPEIWIMSEFFIRFLLVFFHHIYWYLGRSEWKKWGIYSVASTHSIKTIIEIIVVEARLSVEWFSNEKETIKKTYSKRERNNQKENKSSNNATEMTKNQIRQCSQSERNMSEKSILNGYYIFGSKYDRYLRESDLSVVNANIDRKLIIIERMKASNSVTTSKYDMWWSAKQVCTMIERYGWIIIAWAGYMSWISIDR